MTRRRSAATEAAPTYRYVCSEGHLIVAQYPRTWCPYVRPYRDGSACGARLEPAPPPA